MDLNKLRTFTVVAKHLSITLAAEELYRTQPAVSNQLKDLEDELQLILFERKKSRIYLTKEGTELYEKAQEYILKLEDTVIRIKKDNKNLEGTIKLAVERDVVSHMLPKVIREFNKHYPNVSFEIISSKFGEIDSLLVNNDVDFALTVLYTEKEFFSTTPFFTFSRTLVATKELVDKHGLPNSIEDLLQFNFVGYSSQMGDLRFWLKKNELTKYTSLFEKQIKSTVVHDAYTLNEMIFSNIGAGFAFDHMATIRNAPSLVPLFKHAKPIYITVDLAFKKVRNESYLQEAFRKFIISKQRNFSI